MYPHLSCLCLLLLWFSSVIYALPILFIIHVSILYQLDLIPNIRDHNQHPIDTEQSLIFLLLQPGAPAAAVTVLSV